MIRKLLKLVLLLVVVVLALGIFTIHKLRSGPEIRSEDAGDGRASRAGGDPLRLHGRPPHLRILHGRPLLRPGVRPRHATACGRWRCSGGSFREGSARSSGRPRWTRTASFGPSEWRRPPEAGLPIRGRRPSTGTWSGTPRAVNARPGRMAGAPAAGVRPSSVPARTLAPRPHPGDGEDHGLGSGGLSDGAEPGGGSGNPGGLRLCSLSCPLP